MSGLTIEITITWCANWTVFTANGQYSSTSSLVYRVSNKKTLLFLARNSLLASARNKFSVSFERERLNDFSGQFANNLSAARNQRVLRKFRVQFSIPLAKRLYFRKKWSKQNYFRNYFVHKTYFQCFKTKNLDWLINFPTESPNTEKGDFGEISRKIIQFEKKV